MSTAIKAPRVLSPGDLAKLAERINALSQLVANVRLGDTTSKSAIRVHGNAAALDINLDGVQIQGYAPANAAVLAELGEEDGVLTYDGVKIGQNGLTQSDIAWSPSVIVSLTGDKVRRLYLAGNTTITFTDLAAARECQLLIYGGAAPYSLTWQTGMIWHEEGAGPVIMPTSGHMAVHVYCAGTAATDIWISRNGGN